MYRKEDLIKLEGFPKYYIDPITQRVISFKLQPEGFPLSWSFWNVSWDNRFVNLCKDGKKTKFTYNEMMKMIMVEMTQAISEREEATEEKQDWIVSYNGTPPRFFNFTVTEEAIKEEVEYLAKRNPDVSVSYYKKVKSCIYKQLVWSK